MKGVILDFSIQEAKGVITTPDGKRYQFMAQEWKAQTAPTKGEAVDFDVDANGNATGVYQALGASTPQGSAVQNASDGMGGKARSAYNMLDWYKLGIKNYIQFSGRAERKEFWFYVLVYFIAILVLSFIDGIIFGAETGVLSTLFGLFSLLPTIAISMRRLHDIGKSGWWLLLGFIPIIGAIILIIWYAKRGDAGANQYGPNPAVAA